MLLLAWQRSFYTVLPSSPMLLEYRRTWGTWAEVGQAEVVGPIRAQYGGLGVSQSAERSHPSRMVIMSYGLPVHCHGRGRGFEPRRPRHTTLAKTRVYGTVTSLKYTTRVL